MIDSTHELMPLILSNLIWNDAYLTNNPIIDFTHKDLLSQISGIVESLRVEKMNETDLALKIAEIVGILKLHAKSEELHGNELKLSKTLINEHEKHHQDFIKKIDTYAGDLASQRAVSSITILGQLSREITRHIVFEALTLKQGP